METFPSPPESRWPTQEQWLTYVSFRGPYVYPPFPCCNGSCYSPILFYGKTPCRLFFPPGPGHLSSPLFLASLFFSPISLPFLLLFCFPPSLSLIIYQFLLPLLCCLLFHIGSFSALPVLHRHFSHPSSPQFSTERLHPPCKLQCYWIIHSSHSYLF